MQVPPLLLLLLLLLSSSCSPPGVDAVPDPLLTFSDTDPVTGNSVVCDRCPPGTYLRARCTESQKSACTPCPQGSFTELWNYIGKCLRCGACRHNQVVKSACTAERDCQCECRAGFFHLKKYDTCQRHSQCPTGHEPLSTGTPDADTVCRTCPNGTFSDVASTVENCTEHKRCDGAGLQLLLKGSTWHDSVCLSCSTSTDGADYLREILPSFFVHHRMPLRRLRQILRHLLREDGVKLDGVSSIDLPELHRRINAWVAMAPVERIRQLPLVLGKVGASGAEERVQSKLSRVDQRVTELCGLNNEV